MRSNHMYMSLLESQGRSGRFAAEERLLPVLEVTLWIIRLIA